MKTVAIVQSNYIPWKGYFDLIRSADVFVVLDDVQFTKRDWRNRNRIKTAQGTIWLTIPVQVKGRYSQSIAETQVAGRDWAGRHLSALRHSYGKAPHFGELEPLLERLYAEASAQESLSAINEGFMRAFCDVLEIDTPIVRSAAFALADGATERLVSICSQLGATRYLSGPAARAYLDESLFHQAGIEVSYFDYDGYREYRQLYPPFVHTVSVIDLLAHTGAAARTFLERR